jgi:predicted membrane-bound spermidine synthase
MFCLSGFCGLAYQIVWLRKAFAVFGVITPVISVVVSVFMLGLFLGSWAGGKWIKAFTRKHSVSAIYLYALAESMIGIGGVSVPYLFLFGDQFLLPIGNTGSFTYLLFSGLLIAIVMVPWCIFMGTTYPFMMAFLEEHYPQEKSGFSFLYLANVIGAMAGTLITALFLIELFGFKHTLFIAACMNFTVALLAVLLGLSFSQNRLSGASDIMSGENRQMETSVERPLIPYLTRTILFITGFSSMGMEVIWARSFTPALGTFIYSFAVLLFTYLLATSVGSYFYRRHREKLFTWGIPIIVAAIAVSVFLPVVFTDWRVPVFRRLPVLSIFPFCFLLGYLTPKLIDEYSNGDPDRAGKAYAINIAGCVLGPLVASYLLLPFFGSRFSIIILTIPILWLFIKHWNPLRTAPVWRAILASVIAAVLFCSLFVSTSFEEVFKKGVIRHDYTATVVSYGTGLKKHLLVNGVGMTILTPSTKDMAHMPLAFLNHKPQSALMICFGMGTTFRSLASWGIDVTAVELVPSVKEAFGYYHEDAKRVLSLPNVRILVDDGRRFLRRTKKMYDVITIDPPPPVEAAGSSLIYSEEFYSLIRLRLKPDGIMQQWFPDADDPNLLNAVTTSITHSFPYVLMYRDKDMGYHYLASMSPINIPSAAQAISRMPEDARKDRLEWDLNSAERLTEIWNWLLDSKVDTASYTMNPEITITDDRPFNEYYLIRYLKKMNLQSFIAWISGFLRNEQTGSSYNHYINAYMVQGDAYIKSNQYQQAIKNFTTVIEMNPNYIAYHNRGIAYAQLGQYHRAIGDFNEAIRLKPDSADTYVNLGLASFAIGKNDKGCLYTQKACELGKCEYLEMAKNKGYCR